MKETGTNWATIPQRGFVSRSLWQARIFGAYFAQFVKMRLAYRMDFMVDTLAVSFSMVIQLAVLSTLFSKVKALQGWSFEEVLFIYAFSLLPLGFFNLVSINLYRFSDQYIIQGKFDRVLLRPVGTLAQVMFESFNVSGLNEILLGIVLMIYSGMKLGLDFGVQDVLILAILVPSASLVYMGVFLPSPRCLSGTRTGWAWRLQSTTSSGSAGFRSRSTACPSGFS